MPAPKPTRLIGVDYGLARIGLAVSDETKLIASPFKTIASEKKLEGTAKRLISAIEELKSEKSCDIEAIVIGIPLRMNGQVGVQADEVKALAQVLETLVDIPIILWDERLTTVQAERMLREGKMSRKKRSKVIDNVAATIILQSYLDQRG